MFDVSVQELMIVLLMGLFYGKKEDIRDIIKIYRNISEQVKTTKNSLNLFLEDITSEVHEIEEIIDEDQTKKK